MADNWNALWANPWQEASFEGWVGASLCLPGQLQNRDHAPLYLRYFWWYILCCVRYPWCIRYFLCCVCILCNPECWYLMLSIIFGGGQSDAVCCVQRCILFLLYILNCYELKCSSERWAKIWARHRVCWISGYHPEIICCFELCCLVIFGHLTKAEKRVSLDVPHNMQFIYKAKCVYTCSALVAWDQGA